MNDYSPDGIKLFLDSQNTNNNDNKARPNQLVDIVRMAKYENTLFSIRTHCSYYFHDMDSPIPELNLFLEPMQYFHIKLIYDDYWWLAFRIKPLSKLGFIPSAKHIEITYKASLIQRILCKKFTKLKTITIDRNESNNIPIKLGFDQEKNKKSNTKTLKIKIIPNHPYEYIPTIRPILFIGPTSKKIHYTTLIQNAIISKLSKKFENLIVYQLNSNVKILRSISHWKKKAPHTIDRDDYDQCIMEIKEIFKLCHGDNLIVLENSHFSCPTFEVPIIDPIYIYIRINNPLILESLRKSDDQITSKNLMFKSLYALSKYDNGCFDLIIDESELSNAFTIIYEYLISYWNDIHIKGNDL